jgi:outer membrane lipoprotein-sorting protein
MRAMSFLLALTAMQAEAADALRAAHEKLVNAKTLRFTYTVTMQGRVWDKGRVWIDGRTRARLESEGLGTIVWDGKKPRHWNRRLIDSLVVSGVFWGLLYGD